MDDLVKITEKDRGILWGWTASQCTSGDVTWVQLCRQIIKSNVRGIDQLKEQIVRKKGKPSSKLQKKSCLSEQDKSERNDQLTVVSNSWDREGE